MRSPWISNIFRATRKPVRPDRARGGLVRLMLLVLLPLALGPVVAVALILYWQAQADVANLVNAQLVALSSLKRDQISQWALDRAAEMDRLARAPDVAEAAHALVAPASTESTRQDAARALQQRFDAYLDSPTNSGFSALLLARSDTGDVVVASAAGQGLLGQSLRSTPAYAAARTGGALLAPPAVNPLFDASRVTALAAARVAEFEGLAPGVLVGVILPDRLLSLISPTPGLGRTGRAYVITGEGYELGAAITPEAPRADSEGIQRAMMHETGIGQYANPQGRLVLGVYTWLPEYDLALLVEQDEDEAFIPLTRAGTVYVVIVAVALVTSTLGVVMLTRRLTRPIQDITEGALRLAAGDLGRQVHIEREDEVGMLAQAFNNMGTQLRDLYAELERRVEARTRQLAAAAEVGRATTSILSLDALLARAVALIRDRFGFDHVSIFLLDDAGEYAWLREAMGGAAADQPARDFRLAVGSASLIGWVTANKQPRSLSASSDDSVPLRRELLAGARSEAAIPLRIGDRVIGALDVQSRASDAFGPSEMEVLQILADQLAVAVENGRLFGRQARISQLEQTVAALTTRIHRAPTFESILESTATELGRALGARKAIVRLHPVSPGAADEPASPGASARGNGPNNGPSRQ